MEGVITNIKNDIETNTKFDKLFREEFKDFKADMNDKFKTIEDGQKQIINHLLSSK